MPRPLSISEKEAAGVISREGTKPRPAGARLAGSYVNFYIANGAVLVPTFNDPNDRVALGLLAELIADRPVVGIHAVDLVWGLGTIHCLTQQEPALEE